LRHRGVQCAHTAADADANVHPDAQGLSDAGANSGAHANTGTLREPDLRLTINRLHACARRHQARRRLPALPMRYHHVHAEADTVATSTHAGTVAGPYSRALRFCYVFGPESRLPG